MIFAPAISRTLLVIVVISSRKIWRRSIGRTNSVGKVRCDLPFGVDHGHDIARPIYPSARQCGKLPASLEFRAANENPSHLRVVRIDLWAGERSQSRIKRRRAGKHLRVFQDDHGQHRDTRGEGVARLGHHRAALLQRLWASRSATKACPRAWFITSRSR